MAAFSGFSTNKLQYCELVKEVFLFQVHAGKIPGRQEV